jgi:phosphatidate phosphatase PAH1
MNNVYTSYDATYVIQAAGGVAKTSTNIEDGDIVLVTSFDGTVTKTYNIVVRVSVETIDQIGAVKMYPNPTNGAVNISFLTSTLFQQAFINHQTYRDI